MKTVTDDVRTVKAVLEYDGTDFFGWQVQPDRRTVQGELERAIRAVTGETVRAVGAGRTDTGVHALGQVASFALTTALPDGPLQKALNAVLARDIRILSMDTRDPSFDARRDAVSRTYRYVISKVPRAVGRRYAWCPTVRFDVDPMIEASLALKGMHTWKTFSKAGGETGNFESTVREVHWDVDDREIRFEITAERFFHNMVRILMGTLLEVGRGRLTVTAFRDLLRTSDRTQAGPTVPPAGLFLVRVEYRNA